MSHSNSILIVPKFVLEEQYLSHRQLLARQARRLHRVRNHKLATPPTL